MQNKVVSMREKLHGRIYLALTRWVSWQELMRKDPADAFAAKRATQCEVQLAEDLARIKEIDDALEVRALEVAQ